MILAVLQARVSSTRLPGKVLMPILNRPMLWYQLERIARSTRIDKIIVATSTESSDDPIEQLCTGYNIECYRGSLDDVLDRFYRSVAPYRPDHIVRLTGDCPLADPELIDKIVTFHLSNSFDYTSNTLAPTFPDGLDVEVFKYSCLTSAWQNANLSSEREHVTSFIYKQPSRYRLGNYANSRDLSNLRWTVDEPSDFKLIMTIYNQLYPNNPNFSTEDVLSLIDTYPELVNLNIHLARNEGYAKSLARDELLEEGNK